MDFPLYDALAKQASGSTPSPAVWNYVMNLPAEHTEIVFALIWHHASLHGNLPPQGKAAKRTALPYQGKLFEGGKGVVFRMDDLPTDLKAVLAAYVGGVIKT